ncbi:UNVERIFIED_CONTAM: hypothetical protein GTU68_045602 [Idotea baltica]|nr:hypothetical protein [Idotea baltica]
MAPECKRWSPTDSWRFFS